MKIKCEIELDLETGGYGFRVENLTRPGEPVDFGRLRKILERVLDDMDQQVVEDG